MKPKIHSLTPSYGERENDYYRIKRGAALKNSTSF